MICVCLGLMKSYLEMDTATPPKPSTPGSRGSCTTAAARWTPCGTQWSLVDFTMERGGTVSRQPLLSVQSRFVFEWKSILKKIHNPTFFWIQIYLGVKQRGRKILSNGNHSQITGWKIKRYWWLSLLRGEFTMRKLLHFDETL